MATSPVACECGKQAVARFPLRVRHKAIVWVVVCADCLEIERREIQRGADPPGIKYINVTPYLNGLGWMKIRAALAYGPHTVRELVDATGLAAAAVERNLTAHRGAEVQLKRAGRRFEWSLMGMEEEELEY